MLMSLKQRKIKFEPRIKLNHNIYIRWAYKRGGGGGGNYIRDNIFVRKWVALSPGGGFKMGFYGKLLRL